MTIRRNAGSITCSSSSSTAADRARGLLLRSCVELVALGLGEPGPHVDRTNHAVALVPL